MQHFVVLGCLVTDAGIIKVTVKPFAVHIKGVTLHQNAHGSKQPGFHIILPITIMSVSSVLTSTGTDGQDVNLLMTVLPNVVQSIRAFRVTDLQEEAARLGQHFLYAYCADASTRQQVLSMIAQAFHLPREAGKTHDALEDCLTRLAYKAGPQPGFLIVLEQLPNTPKFDKEARETLLDVFRDAADFWASKKIPFRVFYSFQ